jgi:hypothetical protein
MNYKSCNLYKRSNPRYPSERGFGSTTKLKLFRISEEESRFSQILPTDEAKLTIIPLFCVLTKDDISVCDQ